MANPEALHAGTEVPHSGEHAEPSALGLTPGAWVALAMLVFLLVLVWKRVPGALAGGLDKQIDTIRKQLDEAKALRTEAERLRADYAARIAGAEKDAAALIEHARHEAELIVAKAAENTATVIARREKLAADKIGAAERAAVEDLRSRAAAASAAAAADLIARKHGADADRALVDSTIAGLAH